MSNKKVAIINFKNSNIKSIFSATKKIGLEPKLVQEKNSLKNYNKMILPGVGTFGSAVDFLKKKELIQDIKTFIKSEKKVLAICLGMQILLEKGSEFGSHKGLSIIEGNVVPFPKNQVHLGWNRLIFRNKSIKQNFSFGYFVHSYFVRLKNKKLITSTTKFRNTEFVSSFKSKNIFACQFHPEKSGKDGLELIKKFFNEKDIKKI